MGASSTSRVYNQTWLQRETPRFPEGRHSLPDTAIANGVVLWIW
ncbi:MAG: hypothetical protein ACRDEA_14170 [Microcystaceae cyanobacterium]